MVFHRRGAGMLPASLTPVVNLVFLCLGFLVDVLSVLSPVGWAVEVDDVVL